MWFSKIQGAKPGVDAVGSTSPSNPAGGPGGRKPSPDLKTPQEQVTTKRRGDAAESMAKDYLVAQGLAFVASNFKTPGRGGGEIDLIMRAADGTLVFVEVRLRSGAGFGGAGGSIGHVKRQRIVYAARHYLMRYATLPPCRFDVVLMQGSLQSPDSIRIEWLQGAFDAG